MVRRVLVAVLVAATLVLAGIGAYSLATRTPHVATAEVPVFKGSDAPVAEPDQFARLAETDPVGMLAACLARYGEDAKGFRAVLSKRERIGGKLHDPEVVRVVGDGAVPDAAGKTHIRVRMVWEQGGHKDAFGNLVRGSLYDEDKAPDQLVIYRPAALLKDFAIPLKSQLARDASRYCIKDAGLYRSMLRTYAAWQKRKEAGELKAVYLGKRAVPECGGRECYEVKRTCVRPEVDSFALDEQPPTDPKVVERDGFTEVTVLIDAERRLQIGTILRRADGELVGEYYFRDVELVKEPFPADAFTPAALRK